MGDGNHSAVSDAAELRAREVKISLSNALSVIVLLGAIGASWYSLAGRVHELETQATECKRDHETIERLERIMAAKSPEVLPLLGAKTSASPVHDFGFKMLGSDVAADAAEMPQVNKVNKVNKVPAAAEKK